MFDDGAGAFAHAVAAGLAASSPWAEFRNLAVVGAVTEVALCIFVLAGACGTTELFDGDDGSGSGLSSVATAYGAIAKGSPYGHSAVNWANMVVACTVLEHVRARLAAVLFSLASDVALAALVAYTASLGAFSPGSEFSHSTVNRAVLSFTTSVLLDRGAWFTFEPWLGGDITGTDLFTSSTGFGAATVIGPFSHNAVDRARINIALTSLFEPWAYAACLLVFNGSAADLLTTTTRLVAGSPVGPLAHGAINGTWPGIAFGIIGQCGALLA